MGQIKKVKSWTLIYIGLLSVRGYGVYTAVGSEFQAADAEWRKQSLAKSFLEGEWNSRWASSTQFLVCWWRPRQAARRCSVLNLEGDRRRLVDVHVLRRQPVQTRAVKHPASADGWVHSSNAPLSVSVISRIVLRPQQQTTSQPIHTGNKIVFDTVDFAEFNKPETTFDSVAMSSINFSDGQWLTVCS